MKILMTADNLGGVWRYAISLSRELKKNNIDVILAVIGHSLKKDQADELKDFIFYFKEGKQEWMDEPWSDIRDQGEWLLNIAEEEKPDLVHLNSYSFGSLNFKVPVIVSAHSCVLSWWESVKKGKFPAEWNLYKKQVTEGLRSADMVISPSKWMLDSVSRNYGISGEKKVIHNGLNSSDFFTDEKENYVFSMGRLWDDAKNIKTVLEAASIINYPVYIAGENSYFEKIKTPANVFFTGYLSPHEIADWLSAASVYLLPVKYEPFGYSFLEAAFSECALITGDIPTMREIWDDAAVYVDPENEIQIAFEVKKLMENESYRQMMALKAKKRANEKYSSELMLSEYVSLYKKMVQKTQNEIKILTQ